MRKFLTLIITLALTALAVAACGGGSSTSSGNQKEAVQQQRDTTSLVNAQPVPGFNYSQLRQNMIELETAQAHGVQTTSFFFNMGERDPIQSCPSIGAPIASATELTNPQQAQWNYSGDSGVSAAVIGQMDPTGVYTGNSTGTYVMCVGANGRSYADYWEGFVQTVFGPARWDYSSHTVQMIGPPSFAFSK